MKLIIFRVVLDFLNPPQELLQKRHASTAYLCAFADAERDFFLHFLTSLFKPRGEREKPFERKIYHPQKKLLSSFIFSAFVDCNFHFAQSTSCCCCHGQKNSCAQKEN